VISTTNLCTQLEGVKQLEHNITEILTIVKKNFGLFFVTFTT